MASYTTQLLDWGEQGSAYPAGYSYTSDIPPIEEYDDYAMYHLVKDVKHLVGITNKRLESSSGTSAEKPASPEDGEQFWNTQDSNLEIYDSAFGDWRVLALDEGIGAHLADTTNPHSVTTGQIGAATASDLSAHETDTTNPHSVTPNQLGVYTEAETRNWVNNNADVPNADTVDGFHADELGFDVLEDGIVLVSNSTGIDFHGFLNAIDNGDGTVTVDPTHDHDSDYWNKTESLSPVSIILPVNPGW